MDAGTLELVELDLSSIEVVACQHKHPTPDPACSVDVTHIVVSCAMQVPLCDNATAIVRNDMRSDMGCAGGCYKTCGECWSVRPI